MGLDTTYFGEVGFEREKIKTFPDNFLAETTIKGHLLLSRKKRVREKK
jgi:hypothetical protein